MSCDCLNVTSSGLLLAGMPRGQDVLSHFQASAFLWALFQDRSESGGREMSFAISGFPMELKNVT